MSAEHSYNTVEPTLHGGKTVEPTLHSGSDLYRSVLIWRFSKPLNVLSSAAVGGGLQQVNWLVNIGVELDYQRTDLVQHAKEIGDEHELSGSGVALFTAADVEKYQHVKHAGIDLCATVGVTKPTWAYDPSGGWNSSGALMQTSTRPSDPERVPKPGTINLIVQMPVTLSQSAAVNAVITITEAKTQALLDTKIVGTGTASDAVVVIWPDANSVESSTEIQFCGCRSLWGARLAEATYKAVKQGVISQRDRRGRTPQRQPSKTN